MSIIKAVKQAFGVKVVVEETEAQLRARLLKEAAEAGKQRALVNNSEIISEYQSRVEQANQVLFCKRVEEATVSGQLQGEKEVTAKIQQFDSSAQVINQNLLATVKAVKKFQIEMQKEVAEVRPAAVQSLNTSMTILEQNISNPEMYAIEIPAALEQLEQPGVDSSTELDTAKAEIAKLRQKLANAKAEISGLVTANTNLKDRTQTETNKLRVLVQSKEIELKSAAKQIEALKLKVNKLTGECNDKDDIIRTLKADVEWHQSTVLKPFSLEEQQEEDPDVDFEYSDDEWDNATPADFASTTEEEVTEEEITSTELSWMFTETEVVPSSKPTPKVKVGTLLTNAATSEPTESTVHTAETVILARVVKEESHSFINTALDIIEDVTEDNFFNMFITKVPSDSGDGQVGELTTDEQEEDINDYFE